MNTSSELFYVDENGSKQDARFHDEILNDHEPSPEVRLLLIEEARRLGLSEATIVETHGPLSPDMDARCLETEGSRKT